MTATASEMSVLGLRPRDVYERAPGQGPLLCAPTALGCAFPCLVHGQLVVIGLFSPGDSRGRGSRDCTLFTALS